MNCSSNKHYRPKISVQSISSLLQSSPYLNRNPGNGVLIPNDCSGMCCPSVKGIICRPIWSGKGDTFFLEKSGKGCGFKTNLWTMDTFLNFLQGFCWIVTSQISESMTAQNSGCVSTIWFYMRVSFAGLV